MTKTIEDLFILLGTLSDLLPLLFLLFNLNLLKKEKSFRLLLFGCSVFLLLNSSNYVDSSIVYKIVYPLFTLCEFTFVALFLLLHIKSGKVKKALVASIFLFAAFIILLFSFESVKGLDSVPIGVESLIIIIFSFYYLYEQMNDVSSQFIYNKYHFWIVVGLMIYLAGSFFIYIFASQVDRETLHQYWFITNIFYIVKNLFFVVGISTLVKEKKISRRPHHTYSPYLN